MKPSTRRVTRRTLRRTAEDCWADGTPFRWEFSLSSESFFPLGTGPSLQGVTVRLPDGQMRFLRL